MDHRCTIDLVGRDEGIVDRACEACPYVLYRYTIQGRLPRLANWQAAQRQFRVAKGAALNETGPLPLTPVKQLLSEFLLSSVHHFIDLFLNFVQHHFALFPGFIHLINPRVPSILHFILDQFSGLLTRVRGIKQRNTGTYR